MSAAPTWALDGPDVLLINGLVELLANGRAEDLRVAVAKADEAIFERAVDRDLYRAIRDAVAACPAPGLPDVVLMIRQDDHAMSSVEAVLQRFGDAVADASKIAWRFHIDSSIRQLRAAYAARRIRDLGGELVNAASRPTPERCDEIIHAVREVRDGFDTATGTGAATLTDMVVHWIEKKVEKRLITGFDPIDRPLGGGLPAGLHGIAAGPRAGKSAIAIQIALGALMHNASARVLWLRGEMTNDLLLSRMLACWSQLCHDRLDPITLRDARDRSPETRPVYRDMIEVVGDRMVVVDPPITPGTVERWIDEVRPELVVVDYLQKIEVGGFKDRRAELDHAVRRLSLAATRADIPMLVLSAIAGSTVRTTGGADIGTLTKESNQLDFEAHTFWSLWPQGDKEVSPRPVLLRNNKSRSDREQDSNLFFHGATQFFEPAGVPEYEEFGGFAPR
jgi:replicative DNA helicase